MSAFSRLSSAWRNIVHRDRVERDLDDELRASLDLLVDEKVRAGMRREDARRSAALEMGGIEAVKECVRDARSGAFADTLLQDLRYAGRVLAGNPLFTISAALSLAVGIGANATVFTLANALFFRRPPGIADPSRVVDIGVSRDSLGFNPGSYPDFVDIRHRATTLDGVYATSLFTAPLTLQSNDDDGETERVFASKVTENFFTVLGARPAAGRLFTEEDAQPGQSAVVVLAHRFWTRHFGQDAGVIGRTLRLDGHAVTVVGVAAEAFHGTRLFTGDLWVPISLLRILDPQDTSNFTVRNAGWLVFGARLKPDVSIRQAAAELNTIASALEREHPGENRGKGFRVAESSMVPGAGLPIGIFLTLLVGLVSLVLFIACANLAGVMMARAAARRREIAVRLAIGAGRARLVRQMLTETVVLFAIGGAAGLLFARGTTSLMISLLPALPFPIEMSLALDYRIIAFTGMVSLLSALATGVVPAFHASKGNVVAALKEQPSGLSSSTSVRSAFVVTQLALSILLVVAAGLLAKALARAGSADPGFDPHGVDLVTLDLKRVGTADAAGALLAAQLIERVRAVPGVESATLARVMPGGFEGIGLPGLLVPGRSVPQPLVFAWNVVGPGYFETLRIPILAGRDFTAGDREGTDPVIILSGMAARQLWPGENAVGKFVSQPPAGGGRTHVFTVVGVVGDIRSTSLVDGMANPYCYLPFQQLQFPENLRSTMTLAARAAHGRSLAAAIRDAARSVDTGVTVVSTQTLKDSVALGLMPQRVAASVAGSLGLVGLFLAAIGIYGLTAYAVAQRTREIGVRLALGATSADVVAMVMRHSVALGMTGCVIGLLLAAAASEVIAMFLFGVKPLDVPVFAGTTVLFAVAGLTACYVPARRATQVHPVEALRYE
jgi:predicted permease